ncbi:MAG: cytochrome c1 [Albidovulum sp.]|nr:cytochrome c1 [Albidovulum sp.]MDE0303315.1 cytochrome c1 [Albidovulum sp.]MDE0534191.1 cytochrome c1 [Albidovulum sp.]
MVNRTAVLAAALAFGCGTGSAFGAGGDQHVEDFSFSFEGPFGKFDQEQLQRGLIVYQEVCSACHGLRYVPLRTLGDEGGVGLSEDAVKYFAEYYEVFDPELDDFRSARPTDSFPANDSVDAPDLSLMAKARAGFSGPEGTGIIQLFRGTGGPEYIASLLTGYTGEEKDEAGTFLYENTAFPGGWISMAPPLFDDIVEFSDGSSAATRDLAEDVSAFLMWAAEPKMMARKQAGLTGVLLLVLLSVLLYLTNKKIWSPIKNRPKEE